MAIPTASSFIRKGLLPDNLPSFVSSKTLVEPLVGGSDSYLVTRDVVGRPSAFNSSKRGFQRRAFALPHPTFVRDAALFFSKNHALLKQHFDTSDGSVSRPDFSGTNHRAIRFTPHAHLPAIRLKRLARSKFCLVTDISRCFPSMYTHSIPWALHGKAMSKTDRNTGSASVVGNRLDYIMRQSQDGQTIGLPVGPDHSRVIAEIILTAVDRQFSDSGPSNDYVRHVDDFWVGGENVEDCEEALQRLRRVLADYSLDINEQKTRILPLSSILAETWPYSLEAQLEAVLKLNPPEKNSARLVSLLGEIMRSVADSSDDGILKFFLRKFDRWQQWDRHWSTLEPFLGHCSLQFVHAFDYVAQIISWRVRTHKELDTDFWKEISLRVLSSSSRSGRDAEALWAIWLCKELECKIPSGLCETIASNNSHLVCASIPHLVQNDLISGAFDLSSLWSKVDGSPISGTGWSLALELKHIGVAAPDNIDVAGPGAFMTIFNARCSLYDWNRAPSVFFDADDETEVDPAFALGVMGSDYDDDEGDGFEEIEGNVDEIDPVF